MGIQQNCEWKNIFYDGRRLGVFYSFIGMFVFLMFCCYINGIVLIIPLEIEVKVMLQSV